MALHFSLGDARSFGSAIRAARKELGLTQGQLAQASDCSQRFVSELERGKPTAELGKALSVAQAAGLVVQVVTRDAPGTARASVERLCESVEASLRSRASERPRLSDYL